MSPTLTDEFFRSLGSGTLKILSQSQPGAVSLARHDTMPEPKSSVSL